MSNLSTSPPDDQPPAAATCISYGAPYGSGHYYSWCMFRAFALRLLRGAV